MDLKGLLTRRKATSSEVGGDGMAAAPEHVEGGVRLPYLDGRYHLDRALTAIDRERRHWQRMTYVMGFCVLILCAGLLTTLLMRKERVHVVEVDSLGMVRFSPEATRYDLPQEVRAVLTERILRAMRTVSDDVPVYRDNVRIALAHLAGEARQAFEQEARDNLEKVQKGRYTRHIERIASVTPTGKETFRVVWYETEIEGTQKRLVAQEGILHVRRAPPPEDMIELNPLGFYVTAYQINTLTTK